MTLASEADPLCQKVGMLKLGGDMTRRDIGSATGLYIPPRGSRRIILDAAVRDFLCNVLDKTGPQRRPAEQNWKGGKLKEGEYPPASNGTGD